MMNIHIPWDALLLKSGGVAIAAIVLMAGCACAPNLKKNAALERARAAYFHAEADPNVAANAPVHLYDAHQALIMAEEAEEIVDMEHMAYLAERRSKIAVAVAKRRVAGKEIDRLSREKDMLLLKFRGFEADRALKGANARAMAEYGVMSRMGKHAWEAERARDEAEARNLEAETSGKLLNEMAQALAEMNARKTDRGIVLTIGDALFEFAKADLMAGTLFSFDKLANVLKRHNCPNILIEGHTDSIGGEAYNLGLSQRRANAVRNALLARGIRANRMTAIGYGEKYPVAGNRRAAGRQQNRRVEIVISHDCME